MKVRSHAALIGKKHDSTLLFRQGANLGEIPLDPLFDQRLLAQMGLSCQKPLSRAFEQDATPYWRRISVPIIALVQSAKGNCS